jgi:type I restriction enzyme M protein
VVPTLRKNLGKKNCELAEEDIHRICDTFLKFEERSNPRSFRTQLLAIGK